MELNYRILNLYKTRQYEKCIKLCEEALKEKSDRMLEMVHMRASTILAKTAGNGYEEVDYAVVHDELASTAVAKTPRPGTSFQSVQSRTAGQIPLRATATAAMRSRAGTTAGGTVRARTARSALHTAARASRAATAVSGATFTAGAPLTFNLSTKEDPMFLPSAKVMFEYVFYCEGDVRKAMDIAVQAQKLDTTDWWWNFVLARCYSTLNLHRNAEECLRQALKQHKHIALYLRLIAMYVGLNQPLSALEACKQGLSVFHDDTALLIEQARIYDEMGNTAMAVKEYRRVAIADATNMEAVANIAMYNFYNDQPEIAMRYYRRLLATSPPGAELYNNLALCCLYCNQWDLTLPCFKQALYFATNPETKAEIWFNLAHVALSTGDLSLAKRCLRASLAMKSEHPPALQALKALVARANRKQRIK